MRFDIHSVNRIVSCTSYALTFPHDKFDRWRANKNTRRDVINLLVQHTLGFKSIWYKGHVRMSSNIGFLPCIDVIDFVDKISRGVTIGKCKLKLPAILHAWWSLGLNIIKIFVPDRIAAAWSRKFRGLW